MAKRSTAAPAAPAPLFEAGEIHYTSGAMTAIMAAGNVTAAALATELLRRHLTGDWGDLDAHDKRVNNRSVKTGDQILSAYTLVTGVKVWIITDAGHTRGHSRTTYLLPEEY
jgi:hypothetical protein